jgi:atlastin
MWNEHFDRTLPNGEQVAVLLVDTQGMFDSTLGQMLTASIFGLSTLISSYQVYNVDKRIQEDNLQHLALFSEYGRVALNEERTLAGKSDSAETPFQRLEFLVRDWQSFDDETATLAVLRQDMDAYLDQVLEKKEHTDLKQVREQIAQCFESVSCYLLPHPGLDVPNKTYDGAVDKIRPEFRRMLSDYVRRVFTQRLVAKRIHGRAVTGPELFTFIKAYCTLFREAKIFPAAKTLLAATAEANNRCALDLALKEYAQLMDNATRKYLEDTDLERFHTEARKQAVAKYTKHANMGPKDQIAFFHRQLEDELYKNKGEYQTLNRLRDPFGFVAPFIVPILIAVAAYVLRYAFDLFCSPWSTMCVKSASFLGQLYSTIFFFMLFQALATTHGIRGRLETMFSFVRNRA